MPIGANAPESPARALNRGAPPRALLCCVALVAVLSASCAGGGLFRQYEYEEEMFLSLDGSATLYVNGSIDSLNALRGTSFDTRSPRIDREAVREYFTAPGMRVTSVTQSRRSGRRFAHVRLSIDDVRRLGSTAPFGWSSYRFDRVGDQYLYEQTIGAAAGKDVGKVGWSGRETVAFRLHLPSKIEFHNTSRAIGRGNILVWEQPLADRLHGVPLSLEARMQTQSILYRTLWLFGLTFMAVAVVFVAIIWWVLRRGRPAEA
jgi:hypothetical protein